MGILIGCDPEMFVASNGVISHAIGKIGGSKDIPFSVPKGGLQEDNTLAEFAMEPTDTPEGFADNVCTVMGYMRLVLAESGLSVVPNVSAHSYPTLEGFPEKAFEFGCDPDFDALSDQANPRPEADDANLRTAGGHIHIGYDSPSHEVSRRIALMCDYTLGLHSVLEDTTVGSTQRKKLYGKASCVRWKPYGVEYRTLSSYWLWKPKYTKAVFERAKWSAENHHLLEALQSLVPQEMVRSIINQGDTKAAKEAVSLLKKAIAQ